MEFQLCWVGSGYEAVTGSAVQSVASRFVTRGSDGHGPCLVSGWMDCLQKLA